MPTKVALYTLQSEASTPELEGPMGCCEGDTCVDLHVRLEAAGVLDWSFQFWNYDQKCRIKNKMERLNPIGNNVYVIRCSDVGSELGKRTFEEAFGDTLDADLGLEWKNLRLLKPCLILCLLQSHLGLVGVI
jgi:hypothetical protein